MKGGAFQPGGKPIGWRAMFAPNFAVISATEISIRAIGAKGMGCRMGWRRRAGAAFAVLASMAAPGLAWAHPMSGSRCALMCLRAGRQGKRGHPRLDFRRNVFLFRRARLLPSRPICQARGFCAAAKGKCWRSAQIGYFTTLKIAARRSILAKSRIIGWKSAPHLVTFHVVLPLKDADAARQIFLASRRRP